MNTYVKYGLIFVSGAAVSGGVTWFIMKQHYEKVMDEHISEEVKATREWYEELAKQEEENDISEDNIEEPMEQADEAEELIRKVMDEHGHESYTDRMNRRKEDLLRPERTRYDASAASKSERVRYETFSKPRDEEEEVDEVRLSNNDDDPRDDIYVITAEQFAHERYGFDKVTLYWWELERILSEEDMDILDVPDLLGNNWESKIGTEEKDIVYVRNENLETDYEVVVQHESFYAMRD